MTANITACLVIYNEEPVIRRCLSSIRNVVDEIAVVHDGSGRLLCPRSFYADLPGHLQF